VFKFLRWKNEREGGQKAGSSSNILNLDNFTNVYKEHK
jgi:hypothetical protein